MKQTIDYINAGKNLVAFARLDVPTVILPAMISVQALKTPVDHKRATLKTLAEIMTTDTTIGLSLAMTQCGWKGIDRKDFLHYLTYHELGWFWNQWQFKNMANTKYHDYVGNRYGAFKTSKDFATSNHAVKLALGIYYDLFKDEPDNDHIPDVKKVLDGEQKLSQCFPNMSAHQLFVTLSWT